MDLYIVGAGNIGGFVAYNMEHIGDFILKGFIDDDVAKHGNLFYDVPVLGGMEYIVESREKIAVIIAIANPTVKQKAVSKLKQNTLIQFPSLVHPTVWLGKDVSIGEGCIIYPGAVVNYETVINRFSTINMNSAIGHNCAIGQYVTLSPGVNLGGFTQVGNCSFVGIGASTLQGINIGEEVTVGGMTMVINSIPNGATVVGNPGHTIKQE